MKSICAIDAKSTFEQILLESSTGPVVITQDGKSLAVIVSAEEYARLKLLSRRCFNLDFEKARTDIDSGLVYNGPTVINSLKLRVGNE